VYLEQTAVDFAHRQRKGYRYLEFGRQIVSFPKRRISIEEFEVSVGRYENEVKT
jgi:hypothetical protein